MVCMWYACVVCESTRALRPKGRDGARVAARGRRAAYGLSSAHTVWSPMSDASPGLAGSCLDRLEATPLLRRRLGEPYVGPSRVCVSFQLQRTSSAPRAQGRPRRSAASGPSILADDRLVWRACIYAHLMHPAAKSVSEKSCGRAKNCNLVILCVTFLEL